jgi:protease I
MATILVPIPLTDFDPTETAVPWKILRAAGHALVFATPDGQRGHADARMVTGRGLGVLAPLLRADASGRAAYAELEASAEFQQPIPYAAIDSTALQAVLLPGGHAPGMRPYLESALLQSKVVEFFECGKPVGAICHGVLVAARARASAGGSILFGKQTTGLTKMMELSAWAMTCAWLGDYYRTYPQTVEDEVKGALARTGDFARGPISLTRDSPDNLGAGFTVRDGHYLSARWPGDAHRFGAEFAALVSGG